VGALLVDFAAMDAQFDYPRNWSEARLRAEGVPSPYLRHGEDRLEVVGCATLDASWDRGAGTHVALLRRVGEEDSRHECWAAARRLANATGDFDPDPWLGEQQPEDEMHSWYNTLRASNRPPRELSASVCNAVYLWAVYVWHLQEFEGFRSFIASFPRTERGYIARLLSSSGASFHVTHETRVSGDEVISTPRSLVVTTPAGAPSDARRQVDTSRLAIFRELLASDEASGEIRGIAIDATGGTVSLNKPNHPQDGSAHDFVALKEDAPLADGVAVAALEWASGSGPSGASIGLHLHVNDIAVLPLNARSAAASVLTELGLSELAATLRSGSTMATPAGWLQHATLVFGYATQSLTDGDVTLPVSATLQLYPSSPATLHAKRLWVPDYAQDAVLVIRLQAPPKSAEPKASLRFGVERGGMARARADVRSAGDAAIHPWWCVMRQDLSQTDSAEAAVPLLDAYADAGLVGEMATVVERRGSILGAQTTGDETWRITFSTNSCSAAP